MRVAIMSLPGWVDVLLNILNLTLRTLWNVQNLVSLCCGLFVVFKVLPSLWRWTSHSVLSGRLRSQILDSRHSEHPDGIDPPTAMTLAEALHGLQILHDGQKAVVDIVAVHGLGANPTYAWVWNPKNNPPGKKGYPGNAVNWLVDLLPQVIPQPCRVMTFNYNSTWIFDAPRQRLSTISDELLKRLRDQREETASRPLIFIGHSFGGNVIEQAIVSATRQGSIYSDIADSTVGAIFLGTPHRGSPAARWGALIASNAWVLGAVAEERILKDLEEQSDSLTNRLHEFSSWLFSYSIGVVCYFEKNVTDYSSRIGLLGNVLPAEWTKQLVVPESNACIDGHIKVGLETDHFKINKFYSRHDPSFELVSSEIARMTKDADKMLRGRRNPRNIPADDIATSGELHRCLQMMLLTDPRDDLARIQRQKEKRVGHTCEWLLKRPEFSAWGAAHDPQLLRLVGSPGVGKTMMSIFLVDQIQKKVKRTPNTIFAYFFCDYKDKEGRNTPIAILRSIIRQLLLQNHELFQYIQSEFREQESRLFDNLEALWRSLESMLRDYRAGEVFVLIDALDECEASLRMDFLRSLQELFAPQQIRTMGKFKFLIISRPEPDIENALSNIGVTLRTDSGEINSDLREYINTKVESLCQRRNYTPETREIVQRTFKAKTGATFLWVSLVVAELENPETDQDEVEEKLKSHPVGLDVTYARILDQIREDKRDRAQFLLRIMVAARRPLKKYEIATAFAIWKRGSIPPRQELDIFTDICSSCKTIVHLDAGGDTDDANSTVNFLHQSVNEFVLQAGIQWYHTSLDSANLLMFQVCWKYLRAEEFASINWAMASRMDIVYDFQDHLFLKYTSQEWLEHAVGSYPALLETFKVDFCENLQKSPTLQDAWLLRTAQVGQEEVVKLLLETGKININSKDSYSRTALSWAAENGHKGVAKLLLENGADIEFKDMLGRTPLLLAVENRREGVVKLLLENGADIEFKDKYGRTPLLLAVQNGREGVVKLLLENGADLESKDGISRTPLSLAVENGREGAVKLLLENGADIEFKDMLGRTPLLLAVQNGREAVVKLLLENGANLESKDWFGRTPLSLAVENGHEAIIKLVLEKGAELESNNKQS